MTTIYVNHERGLVLTDSCVTTVESWTYHTMASYYLPWFFKPKTVEKILRQTQTNQKAFWVHDRIFAGSGSCSGIEKYISNLVAKTNFTFDEDDDFFGTLVGASWVLKVKVKDGKLTTKFDAIGAGYTLAFGSGGINLTKLVMSDDKDLGEDLDIINAFKCGAALDQYSDTNVNIYRF